MAFYMDSQRIPPEKLVDRPPQDYDRILQTYDIEGARSKIKKFDPQSKNFSLKTDDIEGAKPKQKIRNIWGSYNYNPTDKNLYMKQPYSGQYNSSQNNQQQKYQQNGQNNIQYSQQQDRRYNERPQDQIQSQGLMHNQNYQQYQQQYPIQQQPYQMENQQKQNDLQQKQDNYRQTQSQINRFDGKGLQEMQNESQNFQMQRNQYSRQSQPNLAKYGQNLIQQNNYQSQNQDYNQQNYQNQQQYQPQQQQQQQFQQMSQPQQYQNQEGQQQQINNQVPSTNNNNFNQQQENQNQNIQPSINLNQQQQQQQQPKTWNEHKYNLIAGYVEDKRDGRRDQSSALERKYYENYNPDMAKEMRKTSAVDEKNNIYNVNLPQVKVDQRLLDYNTPDDVIKAQQNMRKYQFNNNQGKNGFYDEFQLKLPIASHSKQFIGNTVPQNNYPTYPQRYGPQAQQTLPNNLLD